MWRRPIADIAFLFGPSRSLLSRAGRPIKLGGRACDILRLLLMRAGEQVGKRDLLEFAWPGAFVDERNLKVHVRSIRRALGDSFPRASYIATVVGRGSQFIAPVEVVRVGTANPTAEASVLPEAENLIGRQNDIETIMRGLDTNKLVTLVGPSGVGKTSLSITVARTQQETFPDGIHFVDLSTSTDHGLVPQLVATSLGLRLHTADPIAAIADHLRESEPSCCSITASTGGGAWIAGLTSMSWSG